MSVGTLGELTSDQIGTQLTIIDNTHGAVHWQVTGTLIEVSHMIVSDSKQTSVTLELFRALDTESIATFKLASGHPYVDDFIPVE